MGNPRHTIELNGHLYDAVTGKMIQSTDTPSANKKHPAKTGQAVDGFTHRKSSGHTHHVATPKTPHAAAKPVQRSQTLMRHTVQKPKTVTSPSHSLSPVTHHLPATRLSRADQVKRSQLISKFGVGSTGIKTHVAPLPVQSAPTESSAPPLDLHHAVAAVTRPTTTSASHLTNAVHKAESHRQPKLRKTKLSHRTAKKLRVTPRAVHFGTAFLAVFILAGFIAYQNVPNLAMRVAATRAGIPANLPGYQPAGFSMNGGIKYSTGQITVSYRSNSDERAFQLTQKASDLDSETLRNRYVAVNNQLYQTYQDKGKTIYIYDGSNAMWVDKGILYQIEGNSALNSDQLLRLAASL